MVNKWNLKKTLEPTNSKTTGQAEICFKQNWYGAMKNKMGRETKSKTCEMFLSLPSWPCVCYESECIYNQRCPPSYLYVNIFWDILRTANLNGHSLFSSLSLYRIRLRKFNFLYIVSPPRFIEPSDTNRCIWTLICTILISGRSFSLLVCYLTQEQRYDISAWNWMYSQYVWPKLWWYDRTQSL